MTTRYTVRFKPDDDTPTRVERCRDAATVDGERLSENAILRLLLRRGLDSFEREIASQSTPKRTS